MDDFFSTDGPVFTFIMKAGQIIILNFIFLLCCVPVVTIVPAMSAMYYGIVKTVRRERGYVHQEYIRSFKHGLIKGILLSIIYFGLAFLIYLNFHLISDDNYTYIAVYLVVLAIMAVSFVYIVPVLSRFDMKLLDMIKLSMRMGIRHILTTLVLIIGGFLVAFLQVRILPIATITFIPGTWFYVSSFLIERVMKKYMKADDDTNVDAWYLE